MIETYKIPRISIAACRVNARLKQRELAEKVGVATLTVSNWESGKSEPNLSQYKNYQRTFWHSYGLYFCG